MPVILYYSTTQEAATSILAGGFRDHWHLFGEGVFVSKVPFTMMEGAKGNEIIEITLDITEEELEYYAIVEDETLDEMGEWVVNSDCVIREWIMPATIINTRGQLR